MSSFVTVFQLMFEPRVVSFIEDIEKWVPEHNCPVSSLAFLAVVASVNKQLFQRFLCSYAKDNRLIKYRLTCLCAVLYAVICANRYHYSVCPTLVQYILCARTTLTDVS